MASCQDLTGRFLRVSRTRIVRYDDQARDIDIALLCSVLEAQHPNVAILIALCRLGYADLLRSSLVLNLRSWFSVIAF